MSGINKAGNSDQHIAALQKFDGDIAQKQWVLFLGSDAFAQRGDERKAVLSRLASQACGTASNSAMAEKIRHAVQENNVADLSTALFGRAWDGVTFLDEDRKLNVHLRKQYAEELPGRGEIDVYKGKSEQRLRKLIEKFHGIILTTCQDETVEAFWEYENSLPADTIVHTPQLIAGSNDWSRWLHTAEETTLPRFRNELPLGNTILIKLFGSIKQYEKMLLSKGDLDDFYPRNSQSEDWESVNTLLFLKKIFLSRNILFVGVNLKNDWLLNAANGILALLAEPVSNVKRFAFQCKNFDTQTYHLQTIDNIPSVIMQRVVNSPTEESAEKILSQEEEILEQFWQFYNRRPRKPFEIGVLSHARDGAYNRYEMEYRVLKRDILGLLEDAPRKWSSQDIQHLAIAANNFSDFYDLRDAMELVKVADEESYVERIPRLLSSRFSKKSLLLYQILRQYESGFPIDFLQLLPKEAYGLKSWHRAGIQLANSGVYVQRHGKQELYERMRYADYVMCSAGRSQFQARIRNEIGAISYHSTYSFLYPFHEIEIAGSDKFEKENINTHFTEMFKMLYEILRDKSEEYQQIYALLQTELPTIVKTMRTLPDDELEWKPGLLYYLLLESQVGVKQNSELLEYCEQLMQECRKWHGSHNAGESKQFCDQLMLYQAKVLIRLQSFDKREQKKAAGECWAVECNILNVYAEKPTHEMPSGVFMNRMGAYFLQIISLGRRSTIWEIERCRNKRPNCLEQLSLLVNMKKTLDRAEKVIGDRERALGKQYSELRGKLARLMGEYYFKMSQYYDENRRFEKEALWAEEEDRCYQDAEREYRKALEYYKRSPARYWIQCADTMRSMGDLYCQWMRSVNAISAAGVPTDRTRQDLTKSCYENLIDAYVIYRKHSDLHGIADVLQSMGQAEGYIMKRENNLPHRSHLSFYKASMDLYSHLGDAWSCRVVHSFLGGCIPVSLSNKS